RRDPRRSLPAGAGQHDLAPTEDEGIGRAQAVLQLLALGVRQRTCEDRWSHTDPAARSGPFPRPYLERALAGAGDQGGVDDEGDQEQDQAERDRLGDVAAAGLE